jgi:hypothetical protein
MMTKFYWQELGVSPQGVSLPVFGSALFSLL